MARSYLLIISFFFFSCINSSSRKSSNLIPIESFKRILLDVENLQKNIKIDIINTLHQDSLLLELILNNYNYSEEIYKSTLLFYIDRPDEMLDILYQIQDSLSISSPQP